MSPRVFFDTTMLVYFAAEYEQRTAKAEELLAAGGCISVHVLNETAAVAARKLRMSWPEVGRLLAAIRAMCEPPVPITLSVHDDARRIAACYRYHIYDSLVIASALATSCAVLYSEDMQDGQKIGGLTIRNPFRTL